MPKKWRFLCRCCRIFLHCILLYALWVLWLHLRCCVIFVILWFHHTAVIGLWCVACVGFFLFFIDALPNSRNNLFLPVSLLYHIPSRIFVFCGSPRSFLFAESAWIATWVIFCPNFRVWDYLVRYVLHEHLSWARLLFQVVQPGPRIRSFALSGLNNVTTNIVIKAKYIWAF